MRHFSVFLFVLLVGGAVAHGQMSEPQSSRAPETAHPVATTFQNHGLTVEGCPIGFLADRRSDMAMVRVGDAHDSGPAQGLRIRLVPLVMPRIESAEITVYGVTTRATVLPLGGAAPNEISKTFTLLHPEETSKGLQEVTVWMHQVGALTRAELNSLTYVDGSVWHESEGSRCRAVPNGILLVGEK